MTMNPNRQPSGTPVGGQFAAGAKAGPDAGVALADADIPIVLDGWDSTTIASQDDLVSYYAVTRSDERYTADAVMRPVSASYLLGIEEITDDAFDEVMHQGRWNAMTAYLNARYDQAQIIDGGDGDDLVFEVGTTFETAPTERQVVEGTWPTVARIANETDAGTFGSEFVGRLAREHLDTKAFCGTFPVFAGGRWHPKAPLTPHLAWEAVRASSDSEVISDDVALRMAHELADRVGTEAFKELGTKGYTDREQLMTEAQAVENQALRSGAVAVARWAQAQPTTTELIKAAPRTDAVAS